MNIHTVVLFIMRKKPKNNLNVHQQGSGWINIKFWYTLMLVHVYTYLSAIKYSSYYKDQCIWIYIDLWVICNRMLSEQ